MFTNNILEEEYKSVRFAIIPALDTDQELSQKFTEVADRCITKLQSILGRLGFYPEVPGGQKVARDGLILRDISKVFVVHGHDDGTREAVARFLEQIGLPIILHEQSNQGRTIVEKFEAHAEVDFAVVLLTPDDVGGPKGGAQQPRARQNVILELGYFIGKLGRQNVCALKLGDLEIPSDIMGVLLTPFDAHGAWKTALVKELRDAGHAINWNKVMGP